MFTRIRRWEGWVLLLRAMPDFRSPVRRFGKQAVVFWLTLLILSGASRAAAQDAERQKLELEKLGLEIAALRAQQADAARSRPELELQKLELEILALRKQQQLPAWFSGVLGVFVGIVGAGSTFLIAVRNRAGELDQSVHDSRIEKYPRLVNATAPLAIYFPADASDSGSIGPRQCGEMGHAMSEWYFREGGLLLSEEARDAYFRLARALTRASGAIDLCMPAFPKDAEKISAATLKHYRDTLAIDDQPDVERWQFGPNVEDSARPEQRFKDYVFLQHLSSTLRSTLAGDLQSRRRPS
jgi:hypothetical protein